MNSPPGSDKALALGCLCPVVNNNQGKGIPVPEEYGYDYVHYWIDKDCPLHGGMESEINI